MMESVLGSRKLPSTLSIIYPDEAKRDTCRDAGSHRHHQDHDKGGESLIKLAEINITNLGQNPNLPAGNLTEDGRYIVLD